MFILQVIRTAYLFSSNAHTYVKLNSKKILSVEEDKAIQLSFFLPNSWCQRSLVRHHTILDSNCPFNPINNLPTRSSFYQEAFTKWQESTFYSAQQSHLVQLEKSVVGTNIMQLCNQKTCIGKVSQQIKWRPNLTAHNYVLILILYDFLGIRNFFPIVLRTVTHNVSFLQTKVATQGSLRLSVKPTPMNAAYLCGEDSPLDVLINYGHLLQLNYP